MTILSQRDPEWGAVMLGNNPAGAVDGAKHPYNLYWYGCLVTVLAMYCGKRPDEVNDLLKRNGGFTQGGGEFVWAKSTLLGLNQTYISPRYASVPVTAATMQKLYDLLDQHYPLICEIDFNPNTDSEEMHYVLLTRHDGDKVYAYDPWTGTEITLDVYGGAARCIIQFRAYDKQVLPPAPPDAMTEDEKKALAILESFKNSTDEYKNGNYEGAANGVVGSYRDLQAAKTTVKTLESFRDGVASQVGVAGETDTSRIVTALSEAIKECDETQKQAGAGLKLFEAVKNWVNGQTWVWPDQVDSLLTKFQEKTQVITPPDSTPPDNIPAGYIYKGKWSFFSELYFHYHKGVK